MAVGDGYKPGSVARPQRAQVPAAPPSPRFFAAALPPAAAGKGGPAFPQQFQPGALRPEDMKRNRMARMLAARGPGGLAPGGMR